MDPLELRAGWQREAANRLFLLLTESKPTPGME